MCKDSIFIVYKIMPVQNSDNHYLPEIIPYFCKKIDVIRFYEQHDWVIFCILACIFIFIFSFIFLHRDASIKDFLLLKKEESSNIVLSWILTSVAFTIMCSVCLSQFVPTIPKSISNISFFGLSLNKFGFTFISVCLFFFSKTVLTFFFYSWLGYKKLLINLYTISNKYYFLYCIGFVAAALSLYYYDVDSLNFLYVIMICCTILFILKLCLIWYNKPQTLPREWYYKILYICTLQIAPLMMLWKLLFS